MNWNLIPPSQYKRKIEKVRYRLAYFTFCLQNNTRGREMYFDLDRLALDNPEYIQFGSADWFWERIKNTYCIQLEPDRFKYNDTTLIDIEEVMYIETLRDDFFKGLAGIIHTHRKNLLDPSDHFFSLLFLILGSLGRSHITRLNTLDATPPMTIAITISDAEIPSAFFHPNSDASTSITDIQGI